MSGGRWNYAGATIRHALETIAEDPEVESRFPELATRLRHLGTALYDIEHDLDWDLSADHYIDNDDRFQRESIEWILSE